MPNFTDRPGSVPVRLPEPYGSMLAFLSDLWEQADLMRGQCDDDPVIMGILDELQERLMAMGLLVQVAGSLKPRGTS